MARRNLKKRQTTLTWTSDDEPYNDAAMRVFVGLFQAQHDEADAATDALANDIVGKFADEQNEGFDRLVSELVRRRIAWKLELHR